MYTEFYGSEIRRFQNREWQFLCLKKDFLNFIYS